MVASAAAEDGFVSVQWLAGRAEIHPVTYYDYVRQGKAPPPRRGIPRAEALAWLESRAAEAKALADKASAAVHDLGKIEGAKNE